MGEQPVDCRLRPAPPIGEVADGREGDSGGSEASILVESQVVARRVGVDGDRDAPEEREPPLVRVLLDANPAGHQSVMCARAPAGRPPPTLERRRR